MTKIAIAVAVALMGLSSFASAAKPEEVYTKHCAACHGTGVAGAPKKGDKAAWAPRLKQGDAVLLKNAKNGIRAMPPKGLCTSCSDGDLQATIKYMSK